MSKQLFIPKNKDFRLVIDSKLERQFFMNLLKMRLTEIEPGYVTAQVDIEQIHEQQNGFVHGGLTATIADVAMGFAAFSLVEAGKGMVTSKLDIAYLKPAKNGKLIAKGSVIKAGNLLYYCEADILNVTSDGETLVARGYATMCSIDLPKE